MADPTPDPITFTPPLTPERGMIEGDLVVTFQQLNEEVNRLATASSRLHRTRPAACGAARTAGSAGFHPRRSQAGPRRRSPRYRFTPDEIAVRHRQQARPPCLLSTPSRPTPLPASATDTPLCAKWSCTATTWTATAAAPGPRSQALATRPSRRSRGRDLRQHHDLHVSTTGKPKGALRTRMIASSCWPPQRARHALRRRGHITTGRLPLRANPSGAEPYARRTASSFASSTPRMVRLVNNQQGDLVVLGDTAEAHRGAARRRARHSRPTPMHCLIANAAPVPYA